MTAPEPGVEGPVVDEGLRAGGAGVRPERTVGSLPTSDRRESGGKWRDPLSGSSGTDPAVAFDHAHGPL